MDRENTNFGTVMVVRGGRSLEREVSLRSGRRIERALRKLGFDVVGVDPDKQFAQRVREINPEFVFIALHGRGGEDGTLQELLDILGVPYVGSGARASSVCMDKIWFKELLRENELPTPESVNLSVDAFREFGGASVLPELVELLGLPIVVKPAAQGSSMGIKFVREPTQFPSALVNAFDYDDRVLLEEFVSGRELAVTVTGPTADPMVLPVVQIESPEGFYGFEEHYEPGAARLVAPAALSKVVRARVETAALRAYTAAGCRDFARVDIILDARGKPQILEINTIPGFTEAGPMTAAAAAAGMEFEEFISSIVRRVARVPVLAGS